MTIIPVYRIFILALVFLIFSSCGNNIEPSNFSTSTPNQDEASENQAYLDSLDQAHSQYVEVSEEYIAKAYVTLSSGDSTIYMASNITKDYRFFGYAKPDTKSERLLLISVYTNDVKDNPFGCKLGAYYDTQGMDDLTLKYISTEGDYVKATAFQNSEMTIIYFEKKWIDFE